MPARRGARPRSPPAQSRGATFVVSFESVRARKKTATSKDSSVRATLSRQPTVQTGGLELESAPDLLMEGAQLG
jgi:hypothetical protein